MKKILFIISFILLVCAFYAFSEEARLTSEVVNVNLEHELFIIASGDDIGIEMDDGVIVHRNKKKIAEGYIIGVKEKIAAAEILKIEKDKEIQPGDKVTILKKAEKVKTAEKKIKEPAPKAAKTKAPKKPRSKWTLLGRKPISPEKTTPSTKIISKWGAKYPSEAYVSGITGQANDIKTMIGKDPRTVFSYASLVLRENGYSITSSNRAVGILLATKPLGLSLMNELWADAMASIDHRFVASFDIKPDGNYSSLKVSFFKEHSQKGRQIKRPVMTGSKYYNELSTLVSEIKKRSEF